MILKEDYKYRRSFTIGKSLRHRPRVMEEMMNIKQDKKREELVMYMKKRVEHCSRQSSQYYSRPTIYKVPQFISQRDKAAYEPQFISIGPYHRQSSNNKLRSMERHKWQYLHDFLSRNPDRSLDDYFKEVEKLEERARGCYSEEILLDRLELTKVMVLDGCFVIELFLKKHFWLGARDHPVNSYLWLKYGVALDLLLLENQLPFFILECLYGTLNVSTSMVQIASDFFSGIIPWEWGTGTVEPVHLLHLVHFRIFNSPLIPSIPPSPTSSTSGTTRLIKNIWECCLNLMQKLKNLLPFSCFCSLFPAGQAEQDPTHRHLLNIPSATTLKDAGVTFSELKVPKSPLVDIRFNINNGEMKIPYLRVDDNTNSIFRNFTALEQCLPSVGYKVSNYIWFMDAIVSTAQDVQILRSHGIISNLLGSDEEVALLFNRIGKGIIMGDWIYQIRQAVVDAKVYSETKSHVRRAMLKRDYFGSPWSFISVMVAAFLILLTLLQTIFAFLSYFQASS